MRSLPLMLILAACDQPPPAGTSVGNPGKQTVRIAGPADSVAVDSAVADALIIDWIACAGGSVEVLDAADVDLLGDAETDVPAGLMCGIAVTFVGPIRIAGDSTSLEAASFAGTIDPGVVVTLWAAEAIDVDEDRFVLELASGGWLDGETLGLDPGRLVDFGADGELGVLLAERIATDSTLYLEGEAGVVLASPLSTPPPEFELEDTGAPARVSAEGCNCATPGSGPALGWLLGLGLLATARRGTAASRRTARP